MALVRSSALAVETLPILEIASRRLEPAVVESRAAELLRHVRGVTTDESAHGWAVDVNRRSGRFRVRGPRFAEMFSAPPAGSAPVEYANPAAAIPAFAPTWSSSVWSPTAIAGASISIEPAWTSQAIWGRCHRTDRDHPTYFPSDIVSAYCGGVTLTAAGIGAIPISGEAASLYVRATPDRASVAEFSVSSVAVTGLIDHAPFRSLQSAESELHESLASLTVFEKIRIASGFLVYRVESAPAEPAERLVPYWRLSVEAELDGAVASLGTFYLPAVTRGFAVPADSDGPPDALRTEGGDIIWAPGDIPRALFSWIGAAGKFSMKRELPMKTRVEQLLAAAGWDCRSFGSENAIEEDWRADGDVQQADLGIYAGHATDTGWLMARPNDEWMSIADSRFGPRLRWLMMDACGPFQDQATGLSGANAMGRWFDAFRGLRLFMGFASTKDRTVEQLQTALKLAAGGTPLIQSWVDAAFESAGVNTEPSWVACVFPETVGAQPNTDVMSTALPDRGPEVPDVLYGLWVPFG